jgi:hypothetical protein
MPTPTTQQPVTREEFEAFRRDLIDAIRNADPVLWAALTAPLDDEPYTAEQQREDAEAIAGIKRGEGITTEQLNQELGL